MKNDFEQRHILAYLDGLQAKVNALGELRSASGDASRLRLVLLGERT